MKELHKLHMYSDWGLLALRLAVGFIFVYHGVAKVPLWDAMPSVQMPASVLALLRFLSVVETLGGLGLIFGALTQLAASGLGIIMIGAIFFKMNVWKIPFSSMTGAGWEFDLVLLGACVALLFLGAGKYSVDHHSKVGS